MTLDDFLHRWQNATGTEKANYQLFLTELCELLELPRPDPASEDTAENSYVFERRVTFRHGDGGESRAASRAARKNASPNCSKPLSHWARHTARMREGLTARRA